MPSVETLAKKNLVTARPDETVSDAAARMTKRGVGAILVVSDGLLEGIFTERDVLTRVVAEGRDPSTTPVGEVCTSDPTTVRPHTSIKECAGLIRGRGVRHMPVVGEHGEAVGILSARDFLRYVVEELEALIEKASIEQRIEELTDPYSLMELD